jgi:hypothetical protein
MSIMGSRIVRTIRTLVVMGRTDLPSIWSWPDDDGRDHMVIEGALLQSDEGTKPTFQSLCGALIPIRQLVLRQQFQQCRDCFEHLGKVLSAYLD